MPHIPTLETERLRLRPMHMDDWPDYAALMGSERAIYMGGPHSKNEAWGMFCSDVAHWSLLGHGALMIDDRNSRSCLGQVGLNHGPLFPEKELGWFLYPHIEGKGYAFEAAAAFRNWAFESLKLKTLVSYIDPENIRSIALAKRLGAQLDEAAAKPDAETLVFRHPVP